MVREFPRRPVSIHADPARQQARCVVALEELFQLGSGGLEGLEAVEDGGCRCVGHGLDSFAQKRRRPRRGVWFGSTPALTTRLSPPRTADRASKSADQAVS